MSESVIASDLDSAELLDEAVIAELRELLGEQLPDFLGKFNETSATQMQLARSALLAQDAAGLQRAVHTLKGSAGAVGAMPLAEACLAFEQQLKAGNMDQAEGYLAGISQLLQSVEKRLVQCLGA